MLLTNYILVPMLVQCMYIVYYIHACTHTHTLTLTHTQITAGLDYLHQHQVVHLDMKSPNVLVWHFPSPYDSRQTRVRQAGNVWLKIADYGISQVSTGLTMRVANSPIGTPGFMAPELFDNPGQEVSSEKVRTGRCWPVLT